MRKFAKLLLIGSVAGLAPPAHSVERYEPKYVADAAEICIERFEDNGFINISPINVLISDYVKVTLLGGYAACVFVRPGEQTIDMTFSFPYAGQKTAKYWTTPKRKFFAAGGQIVRFELCEDARTEPSDPKWTDTGWHTMWLLRETGANSRGQRC